MIVGILKEIKPDENRVSLLPTGVEILSRNGNKVLVEKDAGIGSGFPNELYEKYGAEIIDSAEEIYKQAELILKVKKSPTGRIFFNSKNNNQRNVKKNETRFCNC